VLAGRFTPFAATGPVLLLLYMSLDSSSMSLRADEVNVAGGIVELDSGAAVTGGPVRRATPAGATCTAAADGTDFTYHAFAEVVMFAPVMLTPFVAVASCFPSVAVTVAAVAMVVVAVVLLLLALSVCALLLLCALSVCATPSAPGRKGIFRGRPLGRFGPVQSQSSMSHYYFYPVNSNMCTCHLGPTAWSGAVRRACLLLPLLKHAWF
jgi:hypothetical protein